MFCHRNKLLEIDHAVLIFVKLLQRLLYFMIAGVEADGANQAAEFRLIDLVVIISVKNVESRSHDVKLLARELRYFHRHRAASNAEIIGIRSGKQESLIPTRGQLTCRITPTCKLWYKSAIAISEIYKDALRPLQSKAKKNIFSSARKVSNCERDSQRQIKTQRIAFRRKVLFGNSNLLAIP